MIFIKNWITIVKRHAVIIFLIIARFTFIFGIALALYIAIMLTPNLDVEIRNYLLFPLLFFLVNYAFIKLILNTIWYNFNLILFIWNKVILIRSTLFLIDDVEIIDMWKIMKVDIECRGIIPNILWFGHLIIEQQKNDVRILHFIPDPYHALNILETHRDMVHSKHPEIRENLMERIKKSWLLRK